MIDQLVKISNIFMSLIPQDLLRLIFASMLIAFSAATSAALGADDLEMRGFASIGFDQSDQNVRYGPEIDDQVGLTDDSIVGIQLEYSIHPKLEAVTQIVFRGTDDWKQEAEWAFLSYSAASNLSLRVGRLRSPLYMLSDYLEVGSSYTWVRPPLEVYDILGPFSNYDGADVVYHRFVGDWYLTLQAAYGSMDGEIGVLDVEAEEYIGLNASLEKGAWRFRLGVNQANVTFELSDINSREMNQGVLKPIGFSLETENTEGTFGTLGFQYDDGSLRILGESTRLDIDDQYARSREAFYLGGGYRLGKWMPYLSFAKLYSTDESNRNGTVSLLNGLSRDSLLAGDVAAAQSFGISAAVVDSIRVEQTSYIAGLRYDFNANIALKIEASHLTDFGTTNGLFEPFANIDDSANLYSVAIETIF